MIIKRITARQAEDLVKFYDSAVAKGTQTTPSSDLAIKKLREYAVNRREYQNAREERRHSTERT